MTPEELSDICFRRALVEVGYAEAINLRMMHGENLCFWLANPPLYKPQNHAECELLEVLHKPLELTGDAQSDTALESQRSSKRGIHAPDNAVSKKKVPVQRVLTGICAPSVFRSLFFPVVKPNYN